MKQNYFLFIAVFVTIITGQNALNAQCTIPPTPQITSSGACGSSFPISATLSATGTSSLQTGWYANSFGGNSVGTGSTYSTPSVTAATVFYAAQLEPTTTESLTLPPHSSPFSGNSRGYYFTAPVSFVITGVRVPTDANAGNSNIAIIKLPAAPPLYSAFTNTFDVLYLTQNNTSGTGTIAVNIPVYAGDVIGVLGDRGGVNSYGTGPTTQTLGTNTVTVSRMGMQYPLSSTAPQELWTEAGGSISRVELYTTLGCLNALTAYTVDISPNPTVSIVGGTTAVCAGSTVNLSVSGADTYSWSTGSVNSSIAPTVTSNITYTAIGTYTATGCMGMATQAVTVNPSPTVTATSNMSIICVGESATVTTSGANTYSYNPAIPLTGVISPSTTTTYTIVGADAFGCLGNTTLTQSVSVCTSINKNLNGLNSFMVYPNPSTGVFNIEYANGLSKKIQVIDITGRIVVETITSDDFIKLDISNVSNGIYYFKIQSNSNIDCFKVFKQ